jgi:hypothetical protein
MSHPRVRGAVRVGILLCVLVVSSARAQSYGPEEQVLTVGAAEFRARIAGEPLIESDGYLYADFDVDYWAPLALPEGALLEKICLYANDADPTRDVVAYLFAVTLVPGGEGPFYAGLGFFVESDSDGYGSFCATPSPSYTVRGKFDIDGDGQPDSVAYYAYVLLPEGGQTPLGFGGLQITWKRQVSPAPPTPSFGDVAASDPAFQYIEALVASGITAGCAGGNYCPDANLTRRQMAVFLAKALGLHWTDSTP